MMINEQGDICVKQPDEGAFPKYTHVINTSALSLSLSLSLSLLSTFCQAFIFNTPQTDENAARLRWSGNGCFRAALCSVT